jgi:hypothetical protein
MSDFSNFLNPIYQRLRFISIKLNKTDPVEQAEEYNGLIEKFRLALNTSRDFKKNKELKTQYMMIRNLFKRDKTQFIKYISSINTNSLILWSDNLSIVREFRLVKKIYIYWDLNKMEFNVSPYQPRSESKQ